MTDPSIPQHTCNKCGNSYPRTSEYWYNRARSKDGLGYICKSCAKAKAKQWIVDNPDRVKARNKRYYQENAERMRAKTKKWYQENTERARATIKNHYQENKESYRASNRKWVTTNPERAKEIQQSFNERRPDRRREIARQYNKRNPEKMRQIRHKRWAIEHSAEGHFTAADITQLYEEQCGRCAYCGITLHGEYHVDHIIPLSRNGTNWPDNLALACQLCNLSKNNHLLHEWEAIRGW